jgi:signal transduction histidine kinase
MRGAGLGLRSLFAFYLFVVLGLFALLFGYAAASLNRHALVLENARLHRAWLSEAGMRLDAACPLLPVQRRCEELARWTEDYRGFRGLLLGLSLLDRDGRLLQTTDAEVGAAPLWEAFGRKVASAGMDVTVWDRGGRRILSLDATLPRSGLVLRASFSLDDCYREAARTGRHMAAYGGLLVLVLGLIGWMLLYRVAVRPLQRLLGAVDRISEGELGPLSGDWGGSEISRLSLSLNRMIGRILEDGRRAERHIGELTRLNRELKQAEQAMIRSEKLASVGRLAAGLAHEIGNPLSALLGFVGLLRDPGLPAAERADLLARMERELRRVDGIIRDLLAYSRPGKRELRPCAPAEIAGDALGLLAAQKKMKQVTVALELAQALPPVLADFDLARQVLVNLMFNALDALSPGGHLWLRAVLVERRPDGTLAWGEDGKEPDFFALGELHALRLPRDGAGLPPGKRAVVFCVVDTGTGIAPEHLGSVFDPFFTTKEAGQGTGLGLAICHASVAAMGGEIWIWSRPGAGTQVAFYLPCAEAPAANL